MALTARRKFTPASAAVLGACMSLALLSLPALATAADDLTDLSITNSVDKPLPDVGDQVTFTLVAHNAGPNDDIGVTATNTLPDGLTFVSESGDGSFDSSSGIWSIGNLAHDASATIHISATVGSTTNLDNATDDVTISGSKTDPDDSNNSASASLNVQNADVSITKAVDTTSPAEGANITYTLTVTNHGDTARNVVVHDSMPAGLTFGSASGDGSFASTSDDWTVGDLADSESATLTIVASVDASTTGQSIVNTATVSSDTYDPESGNNTATAPAVVPGSASNSNDNGSGDTSSSTQATTTASVDREGGGGGGPGCAPGTAWSPTKNGCVPTGGQVLGASTSVGSTVVSFLVNLKRGMANTSVSALQSYLVAHGYSIPHAVTIYFGGETLAAVKQYQAAHGIPATGFVGPLTRASLNAGA